MKFQLTIDKSKLGNGGVHSILGITPERDNEIYDLLESIFTQHNDTITAFEMIAAFAQNTNEVAYMCWQFGKIMQGLISDGKLEYTT